MLVISDVKRVKIRHEYVGQRQGRAGGHVACLWYGFMARARQLFRGFYIFLQFYFCYLLSCLHLNGVYERSFSELCSYWNVFYYFVTTKAFFFKYRDATQSFVYVFYLNISRRLRRFYRWFSKVLSKSWLVEF